MKKNGGSIHTIDILFPLLFILLFCFCALLVVLQGARIYDCLLYTSDAADD